MESLVLYDSAFKTICELTPSLPAETLAIQAAEGRVLAASAHAGTTLPPFNRAMMDGYAIKAEETRNAPVTLDIVGSSHAGNPEQLTIGHGQALLIATGSPLPQGADTVVRKEWCDRSGDKVTVLKPVKTGDSVQPRGEDGIEGELLLPAGTVLHGEQLALCQGFGIDTVTVYRRPRVHVIVTGDEITRNPATALAHGQVYSVNDVFLRLHLMEDGYDVHAPIFIGDNPENLKRAIREAAADSDYVITTGGVSVGHRDFLPDVLSDLGADIHLRKILMRPGSPLVAARLGECVVFAMSGNPAASFVQFETLIRPAIRRAMGREDKPFPETARLTHDLDMKQIKHVRILRGHAEIEDAQVTVNVQTAQSSGVISSLGKSNCLIRVDDGKIPASTIVPLRWFRH